MTERSGPNQQTDVTPSDGEARGHGEAHRHSEARLSEIRAALRLAVPVEDAARLDQRRTHLLNVLAAEIERVPQALARQEARQKVRGGLKWGAVAIALISGLSAGSQFWGGTGQSQGVKAGAAESMSAPVGEIVETRIGEEQTVLFAGKTELLLKAETRVRVAEDTFAEQVFQLVKGHVRVSVPAGDGPRSVQVITPQATVSVKGTQFFVELTPHESGDLQPRTRVSVVRGRVLVKHAEGAEILTAGQVWISPRHPKSAFKTVQPQGATANSAPIAADDAVSAVHSAGAVHSARTIKGAIVPPDSAPPGNTRVAMRQNRNERAEPEEQPSAGLLTTSRETTNRRMEAPSRMEATTSSNVNRPADVQESAVSQSAVSQSAVSRSTLSQQNALLEAALLAEKRGDAMRARELVDQLLRKYPHSPLRASAQSIKKRLK